MLQNQPSASALAFNQGSDARIAGLSLADNPYERSAHQEEWRNWRWGWESVDANWGKDAGRWPVPRLPPVQESNGHGDNGDEADDEIAQRPAV